MPGMAKNRANKKLHELLANENRARAAAATGTAKELLLETNSYNKD